LIVEGGPWVVQRVWAMETCDMKIVEVSMSDSATRLRKLATLPTYLKYFIKLGWSPSIPRPANHNHNTHDEQPPCSRRTGAIDDAIASSDQTRRMAYDEARVGGCKAVSKAEEHWQASLT
jgi:hypothetical protein